MMWWLKLRKIWIVEDPEVGASITNETREVDGQTAKSRRRDEKNQKSHPKKHEPKGCFFFHPYTVLKVELVATPESIEETTNNETEMVQWSGIEDASPSPNRVWLWRDTDDDPWAPMRKCDCKALNENNNETTKGVVRVEGGRASADPVEGIIFYNFYKRPPKQMTSATWFVVADDSDEQLIQPIPSEHDARVVEELYQKAIHASSSVGSGIESVLKEEVDLENPDYKAVIAKSDGKYCIRKTLKGWLGLGKSWDLQRGLGAYTVPAEEDELILGPVRHVIYVVHGIGENMWARDDVNIAGLVESVNTMRNTMNKKMADEYRAKCEKAKKEKSSPPEPPSRVEFIPIEWYEKLHSSSNALMRSVKATTLGTIPALRAIANDVIFDVMMYMTPKFCYDVLECVTEQINETYQSFQKVYPDFRQKGGKASLMGHSLGSVICFDLLSVMQDFKKDPLTGKSQVVPSSGGVHIAEDGQADVGYQQYASGDHADVAKNGSWGPSLSKRLDQCLPFIPEFTIFLGSPVGLFLTLRGAHAVFDELRDKHTGEAKPRESPFSLPTGSLYNIFHPSDPVAYRIEPLLLSHTIEHDMLPPPMYLVPNGQDVRLHVKALQGIDEIRKKVTDTRSSINFLMGKAQNLLQQVEASSAVDTSSSEPKSGNDDASYKFPLGGKSDRIDFQLQPRVIESEYISAVLAHSSYFINSDVQDFIIGIVRDQKPKAELQAASNVEPTSLSGLAGLLKHHAE